MSLYDTAGRITEIRRALAGDALVPLSERARDIDRDLVRRGFPTQAAAAGKVRNLLVQAEEASRVLSAVHEWVYATANLPEAL